ncbi:MAG TPA: NAD(P)-dependent oxidoreductase [Candidatus Lokiarchaeia archaeon]|nr:NAD(P)-dependent oxidoreductase [Candidatus Lokiarchaeia archaeon]
MDNAIGWIGTGVMGNAMCGHLLRAGYAVSVYNRTPEKAQELLDNGATWCASPADVAAASDIVFSIVGFPQDVEDVYLGERGVLHAMPTGGVVVDMTTSDPSLAQKIWTIAQERGVAALDAPVSGGDVGAREATLAIMVGGDQPTYDEMLPLFQLMGQNIAYMGPAGAGQHTKLANQVAIASNMIGVVECLLYATKAGLDLDAVIDVIGKGAAASWSLNNLGRRIVQGNFDPGFYIKHFVKDMGIALQEAKRMRLALPGLSLAHQFYVAAMALGWEDLGTHGLYKVLATLNGQPI